MISKLLVIPRKTWLLPLAASLTFGAGEARANAGLLIDRDEVDVVRAADLLRRGMDGDALWKAAQGLVERGAAAVVGGYYCAAERGGQARLDCGHEFMYPTEWDPAEMPQKLAGPIGPGVNLKTNATPTAFERRTIGADMLWNHNRLVGKPYLESELEFQQTRLLSMDEYGRGANRQTMPRIASQKLAKLSGQLPFARRTLLAVHHDASASEQMVFVFGRGQTQTAPLPVEEEVDPFAPGVDRDPDDTRLEVSVELIELSDQKFTELMRGAPQIADWSRQRDRIGEMIEGDEARLIASQHLAGRTGIKLAAGGAGEYFYPVSGDPPEISQHLAAPGDQSPPITAKAVMSHEKRQLGLSVEASPRFEAGLIDLQIAIEYLALDRQIEFGDGKSAMQVPVFDAMRLTTSVKVGAGTDLLIGAFTPRAAETAEPVRDRRVLVFVRGSVAHSGAQ